MVTSSMICAVDRRHEQVRAVGSNGIDFLEVSEDQRMLRVFFIGKAPALDHMNVRIDGGRRSKPVQVIRVRICEGEDADRDDCLLIVLDGPGDHSTYLLRLVEKDARGRPGDQPMKGLDRRYASLSFSFKANCPSGLDCRIDDVCSPSWPVEPEIDYLAKDFASFRKLLLDRLALLVPAWQERHIPDLMIVLVELLAYVGDYLSYEQDAVATEAYLDTARRRISVRRHVRLVDYALHEGCNARAWVAITLDDGVDHLELDPAEVMLTTRVGDSLLDQSPAFRLDELSEVPPARFETFEPLLASNQTAITLYRAHNTLHFYTWGDEQCYLPAGATSATLRDAWLDGGNGAGGAPAQQPQAQRAVGQQAPAAQNNGQPPTSRALDHLEVGDVLILEEIRGPATGSRADADLNHRHAVRLTSVVRDVDDLYDRPRGRPVVEIAWEDTDALPFPLCLSALVLENDICVVKEISVARGNVLLVDHGRTVEPECWDVPTGDPPRLACTQVGKPVELPAPPARFRPSLRLAPLTHATPWLVYSPCADPSQPVPPGPASGAILQDPRAAVPALWLEEYEETCERRAMPAPGGNAAPAPSEPVAIWYPRPDLLASGPADRHVVVEIEDEGTARLRFGSGESGRQPEPGVSLTAHYRIGNGVSGNVGAETIIHLVTRLTRLNGIRRVRNPLPARGGVDPEPLDEARLFAPSQFRAELQRAVVADDYARIAQRHPRVQRAAASLRWTGAWHTVSVAVDALGGEADEALLAEVEALLYPVRRIGHDLVVRAARSVPLDLALTVCVQPAYLRGHVKAALLAVLGRRSLPEGQLGFFHPNRLTFGDDIYVSQIVATALAVEGVENAVVTKLERLQDGARGELAAGLLRLGPLEVVRLDNDPVQPWNGRLVLDLRGGR